MNVNNTSTSCMSHIQPWSPLSLTKFYAALLCDANIKHSGLEGFSLSRTVQWYTQSLSQCQETDDQLIECMQQCAKWEIELLKPDITHVLKEINNIIYNLPAGDFLVLPGGWQGRVGGHTILYLIKKEEAVCTLCIVNTGDGIRYHPQIQDGRKTRILAA